MLKLTTSIKNLSQRFAQDREEYVKVLYLFGYLFFVTSASTLGRTAADTLFLSRFDASKLSMMYLPQAAAMILAGFLFGRFGNRARIDRLIVGMIPLLSMLVLFSRIGVGLEYKWVFPIIYVVYDVFNFLMVICFWQFATSVMDQRKAKQTIGLVGSGGITGAILSGFGLKALVPFLGTPNLIYLYAGLQLLGLVMVLLILRSTPNAKAVFAANPTAPKSNPSRRRKESTNNGLFQNVPHLKFVAIMAATLVLSLTLIDFQFKVILRGTLQNEALAGFMGSFYGFSGLLALFIQLFVSGKVITRFGVMTALLVFPIALFTGSIGLLFMPVLAMAVAIKGSDKVLGDTIYSSVSQLIMFPIQPEWRGKAKIFLDGIVRNGAKGLAAVTLLITSQFLAAEQLSFIILALLAICIAAAIKVKGAYMRTLLSTLDAKRDDLDKAELDWMDPASRQILLDTLSSPDSQKVLFALDLLKKLDSIDLTPYLPFLLQHPSADVCAEAIAYIERKKPEGMESALLALLETSNSRVKAKAIQALAAYAKDEHQDAIAAYLDVAEVELKAAAIAGLIQHYSIEGMFRAVSTLKGLLGSSKEEERMAMALLFGQIGIKGFYKPLIQLLDDSSLQVRAYALKSAGILKVPELVPLIIPLLGNSETRRYAIEALAAYEEQQILPILEPYLLGAEPSMHLPRVLEQVGTQSAFDLMLNHYSSFSYELRDKVLGALLPMRKRIGHVERKLVEQFILQESDLYWKFAEYGAVPIGSREYINITEAVSAVRRSSLQRIFGLMALIYDTNTVQTVFANWAEGDPRKQANATEVVDQMLSGNLRTEITKIMTSPREYSITGRKESTSEESLRWLRDHGDEWLKQLTFYTLMNMKGTTQSSAFEDISDLLERIRLLQNVTLFQGLAIRDLAVFARKLERIPMAQGSTIIQEGDQGDSLYLLDSGRAGIYKNNQLVNVLERGECFGETAILTHSLRTATVKAEEDLVVWRLDSESFYEMIFDQSSIALEMMKLLSRRLRAALARGERQEPSSQTSMMETAVTRTKEIAESIDSHKDEVILRRVLVLQKIELFHHISLDDFIRLAQQVEEVVFEADEEICRIGDFGNTMYGIIEGNVRVHRGSDTFAVLGEGESFGEMAIIDSGPRSASCTAVNRTVLLQLHKDEVFSFCFQNMDVLRSMMRVLADRLRGMM